MNISEMKKALDIAAQKLGEKSRLRTIDPEKEAEQKKATAEYWQKVLQQPAEKPATPKIQICLNWYRIIRKEHLARGYEYNQTYSNILQAFLACTIGCQQLADKFGLDAKKGLCIIGPVGTGKTTLLRHIAKKPIFKGKVVSCLTIKKNASESGYKAFDKWIKPAFVGFDDLGLEGRCFNYGNEIHPMQELLLLRYNHFQSEPTIKTFITTNKTESEMKEMYDERFLDRLKEMCNIIQISGKSYRK